MKYSLLASALLLAAGASQAAEVITEPQGEMKVYSSQRNIFTNAFGSTEYYQRWDCAQVFYVDEANGAVYMESPFAGLPMNTYLKGTIEEGKYVFKLPQPVYVVDAESGYVMYADILKQYDDADDWYVPFRSFLQSDHNLVMTINEESGEITGVTTDFSNSYPTVILGLADFDTLNPKPGDDAEWCGVGDANIVCKPFGEVQGALPEGVATETWFLKRADVEGAFPMEVAFDGDKVYVRGFDGDIPDTNLAKGYVVGTLADGKVSFGKQYMGIITNMFVYLLPASYTIQQTSWGDEPDFEALDELVFDYDAEKKVMKSDDALLLNIYPDDVFYFDYYLSPELVYQDPDAVFGTPATPQFEGYDKEMLEQAGKFSVLINMPTVDDKGNYLNCDNMYYNIYLNDSETPLIFDPEDYEGLKEEIVDIPYNFTDEYNILVSGQIHEVYIYSLGVNQVSCETVYVDSKGEEHRSERASMQVDSGVETLQAGSVQGARTEYFDCQGRRVSKDATGVVLRKVTDSEGNSKTTKLIRK